MKAIQKEFTGSTKIGTKVTTADNQYDILVDSDLKITVIKHQDTSQNTEIALSYLADETESRAVILKIIPTVDGQEVIDYETYAQNIIDNLPSDEDEKNELLNQYFIKGENFWALRDEEIEEGTVFTKIQDVWDYWDWSDCPYNTVQEYYESEESSNYNSCESMLLAWMDFDISQYYNTYNITITIICDEEEQTINLLEDNYCEFIVTKPNTTIVASTSNGDYIETVYEEYPESKIETYSDIKTSNYTLTKDGYDVIIPAGFAYGTSSNVGTVTTGLVITDSVDQNGYSNGNEFVWIPVDKTNLTVGKTDKKMATLKDGSDTDYRSVLYNWDSDETGNTTYGWTSNTTSFSNKEPAYLTRVDPDNTVGITETSLQTEYNEMIKSIQRYGGFYVGRYEMGIENSKAISKIGVSPICGTYSQTYSWYDAYAIAKSYTNIKNSVTSSMIYGSQYDAMLNFALSSGNDASKLTSTNYGNYSGSLIKTGLTSTQDSINNIYDLSANLFEWTQEARLDINRASRGSCYAVSSFSATYRYSCGYPFSNLNWYGSRLSIYIK